MSSGPAATNTFEPWEKAAGVWQRIIDAIPFYVLLVDEQHHIVAWNAAMRAKFDCDDPCGAFCPRLVHGSESPFPGCPLEEVVACGQGRETELFDEAEQKWMMSAVYPTTLRSATGGAVFLHFARDITEHKNAELAREQSLEHHKVLGRLLQSLRTCDSNQRALDHLLDITLGLSWLETAGGAAAFLRRGDELVLFAQRRLDDSVGETCARVPMGDCLCGRVARDRVPFYGRHEQGRWPRAPAGQGDHQHAVFPLVYEGRALGVVNFYLRDSRPLEPTQRAILEGAVGITAATLAEQQARQSAVEARARASALERRLLERVLASQEEERKRVARELHDDLGQSLSALLLDIKATEQETSTAELQRRMEGAVRGLVEKVHQLAWDLRPSVLDDYGLDSALSRHIREVSRRRGLPIDYRFVCPEGVEPRLPGSIEVVLYRVTQEALNNVVRHAHASRGSVIVLRQTNSMTLLVEDDGCGFDERQQTAAEGSGLGLTSMRERVALLQGELQIESEAGRGTSVRAIIPLGAERQSVPAPAPYGC